MIVDDSTLVIKKLENLMKELGHNVVATAKSGKEAVSLYFDLLPDIVTMDITMPGEFDGIEATKRIISSFPNAKILVVTSHGQEGKVREAIKAGAVGYIVKPFKEDKIKFYLDRIQAEI